ncbi:MAG: hypothetical protein OKBPIBMD_00741 [Chlorobi bacterium]|nr:hypothetical protein [Chlorobiota bacterium]
MSTMPTYVNMRMVNYGSGDHRKLEIFQYRNTVVAIKVLFLMLLV